MNPVLTIAGRELRSYFDSPIAYIVVISFLLVAGWMFFGSFFLMERADMRMFFAPSPFSPSMLLVIMVPALTMRLVAEEKKTGTIEFLTTMPVTDTQVIMGKFLGAFGLLSTAILMTMVYALCVSTVGDLDWGPVIAGYIGLLLFVASMTAIGLLCSTLTSNQIVAFIMGFLVCASLYFVYWLQFFMPQSIGGIVEYISLSFHLDNLARGVIDTRDVLYYLSITVGALFLSVQSMNRQHA